MVPIDAQVWYEYLLTSLFAKLFSKSILDIQDQGSQYNWGFQFFVTIQFMKSSMIAVEIPIQSDKGQYFDMDGI